MTGDVEVIIRKDKAYMDQANLDKLELWDVEMPPYVFGFMWKCHEYVEADSGGNVKAWGDWFLKWYDVADAVVVGATLYKGGSIQTYRIVVGK
jgi:hypothetical protein